MINKNYIYLILITLLVGCAKHPVNKDYSQPEPPPVIDTSPPVIELFKVIEKEIIEGEKTFLKWKVTKAIGEITIDWVFDNGTGDGKYIFQNHEGEYIVKPKSTVRYTLMVSNKHGESKKTKKIKVNPKVIEPDPDPDIDPDPDPDPEPINQKPTIEYFKADEYICKIGDWINFNWKTKNADTNGVYIKLSNSGETWTVNRSGSTPIKPSQTYETVLYFSLNANNENGGVKENLQIQLVK